MLSSDPPPAGLPPLGAHCLPILANPRRTAPYEEEPGFCSQLSLWLFGPARALHAQLAFVPGCCGPGPWTPAELAALEQEAESLVLSGHTLVCGIHHYAHKLVALVPLRWGAPRVVCFSGGFRRHLGPELNEEPYRAARLWRYSWDAKTDLAISRRAPDKLPTYAAHNPTVDRLIRGLAEETWPGLRHPIDMLNRSQERR